VITGTILLFATIAEMVAHYRLIKVSEAPIGELSATMIEEEPDMMEEEVG
jgi:hypothetical protein